MVVGKPTASDRQVIPARDLGQGYANDWPGLIYRGLALGLHCCSWECEAARDPAPHGRPEERFLLRGGAIPPQRSAGLLGGGNSALFLL
jgi:hypothetical protein